MSLIERYILAVTERLPEDMRNDVAEELRSNIEDMLPDNTDDNEIRKLLEKFGNPQKLAQDYYPTKRYLIGPSLYDSYLSVLKTVVTIAISVLVCITILDWVLKGPHTASEIDTWKTLFENVVDTIISGGLQAAFWVTIIFAILERSGVNEGQLPFAKNKWSIDDLPTEPLSKKAEIRRSGPLVSMFLTILFISVLYFKPQVIAVYTTISGTREVTPLFNIASLQIYYVPLLAVALVKLFVIIWQLVQRRWTVPLAIANTIQNLASCLMLMFIINDRQLFNQATFEQMGTIFKVSATQFSDGWFLGTLVFTVIIFIAVGLCDSLSAFNKCRK